MALICNKIVRKGCTDWWRSCFSFYLCLHPTGILIKILQKRPIQAFNFPHIPLILRQFFDSLDLMQTWYLGCANMFITRAHNKNVLADGKWPLRFLVLQLTKRVEIEEDHLIFYELRFLSPGANIRLSNNEKIRNYHSITSCTEWINICLKLNLMINRISIYRLWFIWVILWSNFCILGGIQLYFNVKIISFLTFSAVENFMILITKGWNSCITSTPLRNQFTCISTKMEKVLI